MLDQNLHQLDYMYLPQVVGCLDPRGEVKVSLMMLSTLNSSHGCLSIRKRLVSTPIARRVQPSLEDLQDEHTLTCHFYIAVEASNDMK